MTDSLPGFPTGFTAGFTAGPLRGLALGLALGLAAEPSAAAPQGDGPWHSLELPSLCQAPDPIGNLAPLLGGRHLFVHGSDAPPRSTEAVGVLPLPSLLSILDEEARRLGSSLEIQPGGPPILARGSGAEVEGVQALLRTLDQAGAARTIELTAWVLEKAPAGAVLDAATTDLVTQGTDPWARATTLSGERRALGRRRRTSFLSGYEVQVTSSSGVADPRVGRVLHGTTLHVRACRTQSRPGVHLEAFFDAARLLEVLEFEPETPDLDLIQQPRVRSTQVAFSGFVEPGGSLVVRIEGPGDGDDLNLLLRAATPDRMPSEGWRVADLALIESRREVIELPTAGLWAEDLAPAGSPPMISEALSASSLTQRAQVAAARADDGSRDQRALRLQWAPGLLFGPREATVAWAEVDAMVAAAEGPRLRTRAVEVQAQGARIRFPLSGGFGGRASICEERTWLVDYDVQVAPEVWMPGPDVEHTLDGWMVRGHLEGNGLRTQGWCAHTDGAATVERAQLRLGRLQLPSRSFDAGGARARVGVESTLCLDLEGGSLRVGLLEP